MPINNFFTTVIFICIVSFISYSQEGSIGNSGSEFNEGPAGSVSDAVLLNEDINLNGTADIFTVSLLKKLDNSTYWISKGIIHENLNEKDIALMSFNKKIINTDGKELINQEPAEYGYIVSIKNISGEVVFFITIADKNGSGASDELPLKWNAYKNNFEILNF